VSTNSIPERPSGGAVLRALFGAGLQGYHLEVAHALDSVAAAIFLEHIVHWQVQSTDGWAYRTQDQIAEGTALKRKPQETARKILKAAGVLKEGRRGVPARMHYHVDLELLALIVTGEAGQAQEDRTGSEGANSSAQTGQTRVPDSGKLERPNGTDYLSKENLSSEEYVNSSDEDSSNEETSTPPTPPIPIAAYGVKRLMEKHADAYLYGRNPLAIPDRDRGNYGRYYRQYHAPPYDMTLDDLEPVLDYLISRACGEVKGQAKAWVGFGTAVEAVESHAFTLVTTARTTHDDDRDRARSYEWLLGDSGEGLTDDEQRKLAEIQARGDDEDGDDEDGDYGH
jgi:hypothetical protein